LVLVNARVLGVRVIMEKESEELIEMRGLIDNVIFIAPSGYTYYYDVNVGCDVKVSFIGYDLQVVGCSRSTKEISGDVRAFELTFPDGSKRSFDLIHDTFILKEREEPIDDNDDTDQEGNEVAYEETNDGQDESNEEEV